MRENFKTIKINKFTLKYPKAFFHNVNDTLKAGIVGSGTTVNTALPAKAENIRLKSFNAFAIQSIQKDGVFLIFGAIQRSISY